MDATKNDTPARLAGEEEETPTEGKAAIDPGTTETSPAAVADDQEVFDEDRDREATGSGLSGREATGSGLEAAPSVVPGAASVVGAALGLASLTGTWLGTLMSERQQLIGQIKAQSGPPAGQIAAVYGAPWHTVALFNGLFALVAVVVAGGVLLWQRPTSRVVAPWVTAVSWGGVVLGVIGLLIAAAMGFDVFTSLPTVPAGPGGPAGPAG